MVYEGSGRNSVALPETEGKFPENVRLCCLTLFVWSHVVRACHGDSRYVLVTASG